MLLGAPGIATGSKGATRGSWHRYWEQTRYWGLLRRYGARTLLVPGIASLLGARTLLGAPGIAPRSKDATRGSWHRY